MKITLNVSSIDYDSIIEKAVPYLKEKAKTSDSVLMKTLSGILSMPGDIPVKMLHALPQETKDDIVVYLANQNAKKITGWLQDALAAKGIITQIEDLKVEK